MATVPDTIDGALNWATDHIATWDAEVTAGAGSAFGLDTADITALQAALTAADTSHDGAVTARSTSKSATLTQNSDVFSLRGLLSQAISKIKTFAQGQDDPTATYAAMDIPVPDTTPTKHFPVQPTSLLAQPDASGTVQLSWDGSGNFYPTTFVIEGSSDGSTWALQGTATANKLTLTGYTPGQTFWFRVSATHNGQTSIPSESEAIWGTGGEVTLSIAA
ncbi:MAG: fibronectin type III domain-containing protein [Fimbriimonadaceae bacterium]